MAKMAFGKFLSELAEGGNKAAKKYVNIKNALGDKLDDITHGVSKSRIRKMKSDELEKIGFNSRKAMEQEQKRQISISRSKKQIDLEKLNRQKRQPNIINEHSSLLKSMSDSDFEKHISGLRNNHRLLDKDTSMFAPKNTSTMSYNKYYKRNEDAKITKINNEKLKERLDLNREKALLQPNESAAKQGKDYSKMREAIDVKRIRQKDIESTNSYLSSKNDLTNKITAESSVFSHAAMDDKHFKHYTDITSKPKVAAQNKETPKIKDPNSKIYKAASIGVGGGMVLSMFNNRGQQSNAQLYNQQRAY